MRKFITNAACTIINRIYIASNNKINKKWLNETKRCHRFDSVNFHCAEQMISIMNLFVDEEKDSDILIMDKNELLRNVSRDREIQI